MTNVVHLSTGHAGGAGLAARRLNETLNANGINSVFYALKQKGYLPEKNEFEIERSLGKRISGALNTRIQDTLNERVVITLSSAGGINLNHFLSKFESKDTIIQVHNWFNLLSFNDIRELAVSGYKLIFTMHDQRLFTGGCHYAFDCQGFEEFCDRCPLVGNLMKPKVHKNLLNFVKIMTVSNRVSFTAPSQWLAQEAKKSSVLSKFEITPLQNFLGPTFLSQVRLTPNMYDETRRLKIGVASGDPYSFTKGGDLVSALDGLDIVDLIYMKDFSDSEYNKFWSEIDLLFVPSRADNSPNVILEANAYGIPIVASQVGGIPETLSEEFDKLFNFENLEIESLIDLFYSAAKNGSKKISITPFQQTSRETELFKEYSALYQRLTFPD